MDPVGVFILTFIATFAICVFGSIFWFAVRFMRHVRAHSYFRAQNAAYIREQYYREQPQRAPKKWRRANGF